MRRFGIRVFSACLLLAVTLPALEQANSPPPQALAADLPRYYFATPEAEFAARADLDSALQRFRTFSGQLSTEAKLLQALQAYEDVLRLYHKHEGYLHLRCSQNRKDPSCDANLA